MDLETNNFPQRRLLVEDLEGTRMQVLTAKVTGIASQSRKLTGAEISTTKVDIQGPYGYT